MYPSRLQVDTVDGESNGPYPLTCLDDKLLHTPQSEYSLYRVKKYLFFSGSYFIKTLVKIDTVT